MTAKEEIAKIFKEARDKKGWTQEQVAQKAGIDANYYARVERADPEARIGIINKIAKALGVTVKLPLGK